MEFYFITKLIEDKITEVFGGFTDDIVIALKNLGEANLYDRRTFWIVFFSFLVSIFVAVYTYKIYQKQLKLMEEQTAISKSQTEISKTQTDIANKQTQIMEEQNKIALFEKKYELYNLYKSTKFDYEYLPLFEVPEIQKNYMVAYNMYFNCLRHITGDKNINFADTLQSIQIEIHELEKEKSKDIEKIEKLNYDYIKILGDGVNYLFNNFPKHLLEFEKILILFKLSEDEISVIESYVTLHNTLLKYMDTQNLNRGIENIQIEHMYLELSKIKDLMMNSNIDEILKEQIKLNK